jgi:hypothetical protein
MRTVKCDTLCDKQKVVVGEFHCLRCDYFVKKERYLKIVKCNYTPQSTPIFKSDDEVIKTAEIMFAYTGFKPWTKEKIIRRCKENGLIEETHSEPVKQDREETERDIIKNNMENLMLGLLLSEYRNRLYIRKLSPKNVTFKEWLKLSVEEDK